MGEAGLRTAAAQPAAISRQRGPRNWAPAGSGTMMDSAPSFQDFVARLRQGDREAAAELVRRYEPLVRREVRARLRSPSLVRMFDSLDISQSVFGSFFVRTALGEYDLAEPGNLVRLLTVMAQNKMASAARRHHRQRRDGRRTLGEPVDLDELPGPTLPPSELASQRDLLARLRDSLDADERELADCRRAGMAWEEIARRMGGTAQARRMQLSRAIDRVTRQFGLDDVDSPG